MDVFVFVVNGPFVLSSKWHNDSTGKKHQFGSETVTGKTFNKLLSALPRTQSTLGQMNRILQNNTSMLAASIHH